MNKILLIDDDASIRFTFQNILEHSGFEVYTLPDGKDLFKTLETHAIDLIILDIMLPDENGISILEKLKKDGRFASLPVIMLTAKDDDETLKTAFEKGANDFIKKPVKSITELIARIKAQLKLKQYEESLKKINLEQKLEILKQIMVTVEHSFNQPLTVIISYLTVLEQKLEDCPESKNSTILVEKIKKAIDEISSVVNQLKGLTHFELTSYIESIQMLKLENKKSDGE